MHTLKIDLRKVRIGEVEDDEGVNFCGGVEAQEECAALEEVDGLELSFYNLILNGSCLTSFSKVFLVTLLIMNIM